MRFPQTTAYLKYQTPIEEGGYDIWAMEIEHYLEYIDNEVWKIILNGNSKKRISTGKMSRKGYGENIMKSNKEETISIGTSQMLFLEEPMGVSTRILRILQTVVSYLEHPPKSEVPKELPIVSMCKYELKKLKYHLTRLLTKVVKERTTATAITEGM
ncbi:hypothetical protein Tco_1556941 [Tanacetum coccineum]